MENQNENADQNVMSQMVRALNGLQQVLQHQGAQLQYLAHNQRQNAQVVQNAQAQSNGGNVSVTVPKFGGCEDELLSMWIIQIETVFQVKNALPDKKVAIAVTGLLGGALSWYVSARSKLLLQSSENQTPAEWIKWDIFKKGIKEAFPIFKEQAQLHKMLKDLVQTTSVGEYTARFRALLGQVEPGTMTTFSAMIHYIDGLRRNTQREVNYRSPNNLEEAIKIAFEYDTSLHSKLNPERYYSAIRNSSGPQQDFIPSLPGASISRANAGWGNQDHFDENMREIGNVQTGGSHLNENYCRPRGRGFQPRGSQRGFRGGRGNFRGLYASNGRAFRRFSDYGNPRHAVNSNEQRAHLQRQLDLLNNACFYCHQSNCRAATCPENPNRVATPNNIEMDPQGHDSQNSGE